MAWPIINAVLAAVVLYMAYAAGALPPGSEILCFPGPESRTARFARSGS